ncbi:MAG TPA: SAM-dependent methyltransferase [Mycobacteriales bacterium]|nr:SAM-dependent methyltransferase [Mycobacteriales bacterium]
MRSWSEAWETALYGPSGFFLQERPLDHFRTNVAVPLFATAVRRLAGLVDLALGSPDPFDLVDLGAGRGELLAALPDVPPRWRLTAVDLAPGLRSDVPEVEGLLIANEWLDNVPLDVLEEGRLVLVSPDGRESLGAPLSSGWADTWWPPEVVGDRAEPARPDLPHRVEIGASRDLAWAAAVARVRRGLAVAVDYGHTVADRRPTLTGYRDGRQVRPVPDGSCDLTAHVALDSCAAATGSRLVRQGEALRSLGVTATPSADGVGLEQASQARELLDPDGLGGFGWLVRPVGLEVGWMGV